MTEVLGLNSFSLFKVKLGRGQPNLQLAAYLPNHRKATSARMQVLIGPPQEFGNGLRKGKKKKRLGTQ